MLSTRKKITAGFALTMVGAFALAGCSMSDDSDDAMDTPDAMETEEMETDDAMDLAAGLVGPGCEAYIAAEPVGPSSLQGMSEELVTAAAANNPMLTQLTAALTGELNPDVNLVETLDSGEFTVFAPVDEAFQMIDTATIETLKTDSALLESILTYHVVPGEVEPEDIAGTHTTVQGTDVEVTGSGDEWMVNDASVICGGIETENATVYLIDTVLMPAQ